MAGSEDIRGISRRRFLRVAAAAGGSAVASHALAQDAALQSLIDQNQQNDLGQGFDSGLRTITMPQV